MKAGTKKKDDGKNKSYVISVSLMKGCYRHLRVSANNTLDDLASDILDAFDFDHDHLYSFFMNDELWSSIKCYNHPASEETPYTRGKKLVSVITGTGHKFKFLFDYGDEWIFQCKVLKVLDEATKDTIIVRSIGEPPEQYPDYDEDEYEDEYPVENTYEMIPRLSETEENDEGKSPVSDNSAVIEYIGDIQTHKYTLPDELMEAAFDYNKNKLWKKLDNNKLFAVELPGKEVGYCCILGMDDGSPGMNIYIGEAGLWSYYNSSDLFEKDEFGFMVAQNYLQLTFGKKDDLDPRMIDVITTYTKANGISMKGKNKYPAFMVLKSYFVPDLLREELDIDRMIIGIRAANEVYNRLAANEDVFDLPEDIIPLLIPDNDGFVISTAFLPDVRTFPYTRPRVIPKKAQMICSLPKKGTVEACVMILSVSAKDEEYRTDIYRPVLVITAPAGSNMIIQGTGYYPDHAEEMLDEFADNIIKNGKCPKKIVTLRGRSAPFFEELCDSCGIELKVMDEYPKMNKKAQELIEDDPEINKEFTLELLIRLNMLTKDELLQLPHDFLTELQEYIGTGILPPVLEKNLKSIR